MFRVEYGSPKPKPTAPTIAPVPYKFRELKKTLAVLDSETDPFSLDPATGKAKPVAPFTCGFYWLGGYVDFWGDDCFKQMFDWLDEQTDEFVICVHNGGNFDFYFILDEMDPGSTPFLMDGRVVQMFAHNQEFRDSYKLLPVPLSAHQKDVFNYAKMERWAEGDLKLLDNPDNGYEPGRAYAEYIAATRPYEWIDDAAFTGYSPRDYFQREIRKYQKHDCKYLYELCEAAYNEFGDKLTMAGVALPMLRSFHGFDTMGEQTDERMRPFYFGGRCEAFEIGELFPRSTERWEIVDVISMYPDAMKSELHPISAVPQFENRITERTHFAKIEATSRGALPVRTETGGLAFPHMRGEFYACIHEIRAGIELGLLDVHRVNHSIYFEAETRFDKFVDTFFSRRLLAKQQKDKIRILFWKLVLNSSYGKLAQDPRKYETFLFDPEEYPLPFFCARCGDQQADEQLCDGCGWGLASHDGWRLHTSRQGRSIFSRPQTRARHSSFFNVATAASITSAARAKLLRGLAASERPIYCDTDSVICERFHGDIDASRLGAWEREAGGTVAYIAAKKLYAVFDHGTEVKKASKGVRLTADQIRRVAMGEVIQYANPVPKFNLDGTITAINRTVRRSVA